jgi:hypothetical protein
MITALTGLTYGPQGAVIVVLYHGFYSRIFPRLHRNHTDSSTTDSTRDVKPQRRSGLVHSHVCCLFTNLLYYTTCGVYAILHEGRDAKRNRYVDDISRDYSVCHIVDDYR